MAAEAEKDAIDTPVQPSLQIKVKLPTLGSTTPERCYKHENIQGFVNANKQYLRGFMDGFSTNLPPMLSQQMKKDFCKQKKTFTSGDIVLPRVAQKAKEDDGDSRKERQKQLIVLPSITERDGCLSETRVQEAMYASRRHEIPRVSPAMWESKALLSPESFRVQKKSFICSLAADQIAGGPFQAFLHRTDNPYAIKSMHFWHESVVYLSTKYTTTLENYDRVRFQRARQLVLQISEANSSDQLHLPKQLTENLLRLLPADRGDNLLRYAQDAVSSVCLQTLYLSQLPNNYAKTASYLNIFLLFTPDTGNRLEALYQSRQNDLQQQMRK